MAKTPEASPTKSLLQELEILRERFRVCLAAYGTAIDDELARLHKEVGERAETAARAAGRHHEVRDMLGLCRGLDVKPEKGRRKDLKKFEALISDLKMLLESWP